MLPKKILKFQTQQVVKDPRHQELFNYARLKQDLQIKVVSNTEETLEMELKGIDAATANAIRRIVIAQIPTMALHKVLMYQNTSVLPDQLLVHRLGLLPVNADPSDFEARASNQECNPENSLKFQLKVACRRKKEYQNASEQELEGKKPEEYLQNCNIYSDQLKWVPLGNQITKKLKVNLVYPNILIAKLGQNQEIYLQIYAEKGIGKKHAKWSPVSTCFYRLMPSIQIEPAFDHAKNADKLVGCCPVQVFQKKKGKAVVVKERDCTTCRECIKLENVSLGKVSDHFIFSIESTGIFPAQELFLRALKILEDKARSYVV